jgi:hypothetical protein
LYVRIDPKTKKPVEVIMGNYLPKGVKVVGEKVTKSFELQGKGVLNLGNNRGLVLLLKKPGGQMSQQMVGLPPLAVDPVEEFLMGRKANPKLTVGIYLQKVLLPKVARKQKVDVASIRLKGDGRAQIIRAIQANQPAVVERLLKDGAKVDATDRFGSTSLQEAIDRKNMVISEILLRHKANPNHEDAFFHTPLSHALGSKSAQMVELLIKHGADLNTKDRLHHTPLMNAFRHRSDEASILVLIEAGSV